MDTSQLLKKVRKIEIKTRGLSRHIFSGEYHSAFKGRGMSFSEVRMYQYGDDVRNIDWNVTARTGTPHIKVFEEERELTVMLLVDISRSLFFGSVRQLKNELIAEISAVLAFSAISNNDKVGLVLFTNQIELFIPPKKGRKHILRIIREIVNIEPGAHKTNVAHALEYFNNVIKKRSICFLISDFLETDYEAPLRIAAKRHDIIGIQILDPLDQMLPKMGLIRVMDPETGQERIIDTSSTRVRRNYEAFFRERIETYKTLFQKSSADRLSIRTDESYIQALMTFFKRRAK